MLRHLVIGLFGLFVCGSTAAVELPFWVGEVNVTRPNPGGIGAIRLAGEWLDTCIPDAVSHTRQGSTIELEVTHPGINVGCGDAITPWSLTEEFGPLPPGNFEIFGTLVSVDPNNRDLRDPVSGPDLLFASMVVPQGRFHGLGTLFGDAYVSEALDVSADGRVVTGHNELVHGGAGFITREAFAWSPSTGMFTLGRLPNVITGGSSGRGVSADGNTIVGESDSASNFGLEAFRWTLGGGMQGLGGIHDVAFTSSAAAASHNGAAVVGVSEFFPPVPPDGIPVPGIFKEAFRYTDETGAVGLGQVHPGGTSWATDVSAAGNVVVGNATLNPFIEIAYPDISEPFRWTPDTGMVGLGHFDNPILHVIDVAFPLQFETTAEAVSADGNHIVGTSRVLNGLTGELFLSVAYRWKEDEGFVNLGVPPIAVPLPIDPFDPNGVPIDPPIPDPFFVPADLKAVDVSEDGSTIVGTGRFQFPIFPPGPPDNPDDVPPFPPFDRAFSFIWDEVQGIRFLEEAVLYEFGFADSGQLDGWQLGEVTAISDDGNTIVGTGINPQGHQEAWRLALGRVTIPGDANFDGTVDRSDFGIVQDSAGMNEGAQFVDGDFNFDGGVDGSDLLTLLLEFGNSRGTGPPIAASEAIPEPGSLLLVAVCTMMIAPLLRRSSTAMSRRR